MADASDDRGNGRARGDSMDTTKSKGNLVTTAERIRQTLTPSCAGYLKKHNSAGKWQKRYFEIVGGQYFVYYKNKDSKDMLCAMDLWRASAPELVTVGSSAAAAAIKAGAGGEGGADPTAATDFAITWDRYRLFRASSKADAAKWVEAMKAAQGNRPETERRPTVSASSAAVALAGSAERRASRVQAAQSPSSSSNNPAAVLDASSGIALQNRSQTGYGSGSTGNGKVSEWSEPKKTNGKSSGNGGDDTGKTGCCGGSCGCCKCCAGCTIM